MKLSLAYLQQRHEYWKNEIGKIGIWKPEFFKDVEIKIRPKCKSYHGMFSRRRLKKGGANVLTDRIFIYNNQEDFEPVFIDSVLVHEMIHQYIFQGDLKDSSPHGTIFKTLMKKINAAFPQKLKINVTDRHVEMPKKEMGEKRHLLLISHTDTHVFCSIINASREDYFENLAKKYIKRGILKSYSWAISFNTYFDSFRRCTRSLHGIKMKKEELAGFVLKHNIISLQSLPLFPGAHLNKI